MSTISSRMLDECRTKFGVAPRRFSTWHYLTYLRTRSPWWAYFDDLRIFFRQQKSLLENGDVVWGHTVQANSVMFRPGIINAPGDVVFCTDPNADAGLSDLSAIAHRLFQLKGRQINDAEQQSMGDHFADELERTFGVPVPQSVSPTLPCTVSTIFFNRKHLPNRYLSRSFYPIVVSRDTPKIVMVLPSRYWPSRLRDEWG